MQSLEQIIRQYVYLPPTDNGNGWFPVLCKVCSDHGRKGPRAAFKFDVQSIGYHCFNCGHAAKFNPLENKRMPKKMQIVLEAFDIPKDEWQPIIFEALKHRDKTIQPSEIIQKNTSIEPMEIPLPKHFYLLSDAGPEDKWAEIATDYLETDRNIDPCNYPFMLSSRKYGEKGIDTWWGRLIIPVYKGDKLIYYQGRSLYTTDKKYESPSTPRDRVLFGFDKLFEQTDAPLYVVEGIFDAMSIGGVALLGNELSQAQIEWLNRSKRKKVYIPDRFGNGRRVALECLQQGWQVSTPDVGSVKDMNEAVKKYGLVYVMKTIAENICDGFTAEARLGVYSEQDSGKTKTQKTFNKKRK